MYTSTNLGVEGFVSKDPIISASSANGFEGKLCERNIDDCNPDPCHHGTCTDGIASFTCQCELGYTGYRCENQINECHSNPCQNSGKCIDLVNKYLCHCQEGTSGFNSHKSPVKLFSIVNVGSHKNFLRCYSWTDSLPSI
eukprot:g39721.t1